MGNRQQGGRNETPQQPSEPTLKKSTACVVGAGLAGVHVAHELAQAGFDVTVFDMNDQVGLGATSYGYPVAGKQFNPVVLETAFGVDTFACCLPGSCRAFGWFGVASLIRKDFFYFMKHRSPFYHSDKISEVWNYHSANSAQILRDLATKYPHYLSDAIRDITGRSSVTNGSDNWNEEGVAHASTFPISIDNPKWAVGLAQICREKYGVKFVLGRTVTQLKFDFMLGTEYVKQICHSPTAGRVDSVISDVPCEFDVFVLTSNTSTNFLMERYLVLPLVTLAGYSATFGEQVLPSGITAARLSPSVVACAMDDGTTKVSGTFVLKSSRAPQVLPTPIDGTLSLYRLSRHLAGRRVSLPASVTSSTEYYRSFTSDGLPLVCQAGHLQNVFLCTGFGDDTTALAPSCAQSIGHVIASSLPDREEDMRHGALSVSRMVQVPTSSENKQLFFGNVVRAEIFITKNVSERVARIADSFCARVVQMEGLPTFVKSCAFSFVNQEREVERTREELTEYLRRKKESRTNRNE